MGTKRHWFSQVFGIKQGCRDETSPRPKSDWDLPSGRTSITMYLKENANAEHARITSGKNRIAML
jgi:hypothetical protein